MRASAIAVEEPAPEDDFFIFISFLFGFILAAVLLMRPLDFVLYHISIEQRRRAHQLCAHPKD
jgi:hypothetical protein